MGFSGTTIRGVARAAGVDPALVHHDFGTKDDLFAASLELPLDPSVVVPALLAEGMEGLGERVVRTFLGVWDATPGQGPLVALLRSAVSDERAARLPRPCRARSPRAGRGAELRASLAASQVIGPGGGALRRPPRTARVGLGGRARADGRCDAGPLPRTERMTGPARRAGLRAER